MNLAGAAFANIDGVKAMTDVTGFGLLGHLSEVCQGAGVQAQVWYQDVPKLPGVEEYIAQGAVPGGTQRNFASYGHLMGGCLKNGATCCAIHKLPAACCWRSHRKPKLTFRQRPPSLALP